MQKSINGYLVKTIKETEEKRVDKIIGKKRYRNASKLRIYTRNASKRPIKRKDNSKYIEELKALYKSLGINKEDEQKAMSCLLYRFKRCNPYYNMLVTIYLEDYSRQDFFNMCYMIAHENDYTDFKSMYKDLQTQLELETAVTRKQKAKQVYKPLSLDEMRANGIEKETTRDIENIEKQIDLDILYLFLKENCSDSQYKAIQAYLLDGKAFDTRQKNRIVNKLKTSDFELLLK